MAKRKTEPEQTEAKRPYIQAPMATDPGRARSRANYGANENRRTCAECGSAESAVTSVRQTGRLIVRYRKCLACGRRRPTQEIVATV
jgi:hypothetical protein